MTEHADGALAESRLRTLFDSIDEGYCVCEMVVDHAGVPVDYRFLEVNPLFEVMTGIVAPVGRTALECVPDLEPVWVETYARVGLGRETLRFSQGSDAMGRWFDVFAVPVDPHGAFALVFKDTTERRDNERALRESEQRFQAMTNQLPLIVWKHDADGNQEWVNDTFCTFFGVTREEMVGTQWKVLAHPDDELGYAADFAAAVAERTPFHGEVRALRADGEWRWMESWAQPTFSVDGTYLGHLGTSADVTERRRAESALRLAARTDAYRARLGDALRALADPVEVQAQAARLLGEHLGASRVHYAELDATGTYGLVHADYCDGVPSAVGRHRLGEHGTRLVTDWLAGRRVIVHDVASDDRFTIAERRATQDLQIGAYLVEPLVRHGRAVAALIAHHRGPHRWTEDEIVTIRDTVERTWAALEQVRTEEALRVRHNRAELVAELLSTLEQERTVAGQLQRLVEVLVPRVADVVSVEVAGRGDPVLAIAHRDPAARAEAVRRREQDRSGPDHAGVAAALAGTPQLRRRATADDGTPTDGNAADGKAADGKAPADRDRAAAGPSADAAVVHSEAVVPIELGGGLTGALVLGLLDPTRSEYGPDDLQFFADVAQRVGIVLAAARLRQEEHDIAVRLQRALLPDRLVWHPNVVIDACYHAASELLEVGGDWYDTFSWPDGRVGVVVGDVVGHNLDSAATMGRLRAAMAALAVHIDPSPAALLDALEQVARGPDGTDFVTAACVVIDPATGALTYSSAGHPPILVLPPDAPPSLLRGAQAPPLCARTNGPRPEAEITLQPGSLVVLYSDGLVERRRERLDVGIGRLAEVAAGVADAPITAVAQGVVDQMAAHSSPEDDVVVACFRFTPPLSAMQQRFPARSDQLAVLRQHLRSWMTEHGLPAAVQRDVLLGVGEACTNAIEHAFRGTEGGHIDVELSHHGYHLTARVRDSGTWRPPGRHSPYGGRGTAIMRALAAQFLRDEGPGGTTVTLTLPLSPEVMGAAGRESA